MEFIGYDWQDAHDANLCICNAEYAEGNSISEKSQISYEILGSKEQL